MAKFCINCGKKLEDGEVCACQATVQVQANNLGTNLLEVLKGIFVKPIDTIKNYTDEKQFNLSLILIGILSLASALFVLSLVKNAYTLIVGSMGGGSYSLYSSMMTTSIQIPYMKIFFMVLVLAIAFAFIYTGLLYLVNSVIFKGDKNFKKVFSMYAVSSVMTSVTLLVSAILLFVHIALGFIVLIAGLTLNMVYTFKGIEFLGVKDQNKYGYIYLITVVFNYIVLFIITKIFS